MEQEPKPVKGWIRVLLFILPFLIFVVISQMLSSLVLGLKHGKEHAALSLFQSTVSVLFMLSATFAIVAIFRRWVDRESFVSLGFGTVNFKKEVIAGLLLGVVMMTLGFIILILINEIALNGVHLDWGDLLLSMLLFTAVAFNEELLMRGYVLSNLMLSMNRWVALLISSLLFSAMHLGNPNITLFSFATIVLAGLLLGLPYIYTKSLWLPIALHFSWNYFQGTIFGYSVSGNASYSLITQTRKADTIWNGGEFGFEGSLLAVLMLVVAIVVLGWYYHKQEEKVAVDPESEATVESV